MTGIGLVDRVTQLGVAPILNICLSSANAGAFEGIVLHRTALWFLSESLTIFMLVQSKNPTSEMKDIISVCAVMSDESQNHRTIK